MRAGSTYVGEGSAPNNLNYLLNPPLVVRRDSAALNNIILSTAHCRSVLIAQPGE